MKAEELRIGNLIQGYVTSIPHVKHLHTTDFSTIAIISGDVDMKGQLIFEPIPLTDEWLYKLGFELTYWKTDNSPALWRIGDIDFLTYMFDSLHYHNLNLKYVHQLQNYYFSLTEQELIYND